MNRDEAICVVRGIKDGTARADTLEGDFGRVVEATSICTMSFAFAVNFA